MGTDYGNFNKSDMGAQAAWKGFSSQTLYIASRLMSASDEYLFCPEDIEDLVVKKDDAVIEAVQVKNISSDLYTVHIENKNAVYYGLPDNSELWWDKNTKLPQITYEEIAMMHYSRIIVK